MGGTGSRRVRGVPHLGDSVDDREPLEDGTVSEARDACRESGGGLHQNGHERPDGGPGNCTGLCEERCGGIGFAPVLEDPGPLGLPHPVTS